MNSTITNKKGNVAALPDVTIQTMKGRFNFNMKKQKKRRDPDLKKEYLEGDEAAKYLRMSPRKLPILRKYKMLKYAKFGRSFVYRREWLDQFAEQYAGYDLSNEQLISTAAAVRAWEVSHGS